MNERLDCSYYTPIYCPEGKRNTESGEAFHAAAEVWFAMRNKGESRDVTPFITENYTNSRYTITCGPDVVPSIVLKTCASVLTPCLVKLFHLYLFTSTVSSCWKFAHIQSVPKKGDRSNPSSYRPIALTESILKKKILKHVSDHNLLSDRQYGFRKG